MSKDDGEFRIEKDPLGELRVPVDAYYGVQAARAVENFPISGMRAHPEMVTAIALIKWAAAHANHKCGKLPSDKADPIIAAAAEVVDGKLRDHFVIDVFQAGAGTSFNMNANEVICNRALEMLGHRRGAYGVLHPNDDVNASQSTNDVFPTTMRLASLAQIEKLKAALDGLASACEEKATEFDEVVKPGRTHLQDAVPIRLGQEFDGWARSVRGCAASLQHAGESLLQLNLGATAVGTGMNSPEGYREQAIDKLAEATGFALKPAESMVQLTQSMADFVEVHGSIKRLAVELTRIANDLRLLSSGPRTGLNEIVLPPVQPGSSIMPGKVNPVMAEMLNMVCFQVIGNDAAVMMAAQAGQMELNVMMPAIAFNMMLSTEILTNACRVVAERCSMGIQANEKRCVELCEQSLALATPLALFLGYQKAAEISHLAADTGRTIRELALENPDVPKDKLNEALDLRRLTGL